MNWRRWALPIVSVAVLVVLNGMIWQKERLIDSGQTMYLKLAPVDPRSLIQGDYMRLSYAMADKIGEARAERQTSGRVVVRLDDRKVAEFVRVYRGGELGDGERLLRWKYRSRIAIGANAYYFEEGQAEAFESADYGEVVVAPNGATVLVGLRDAKLRRLGPSSAAEE